MSTDCLLCKLYAGELEISFLHRDEFCSASMGLQPVTLDHYSSFQTDTQPPSLI